MSKIYIPIGLALSIFLHITLLKMPHSNETINGEYIKEAVKCPVTAFVPKEIPEAEVEKLKKPKKEKTLKEEEMTEVFKASPVNQKPSESADGSIKIEEQNNEYLPALRVDISDYKCVVEAIRYFGMRILLLNNMGNFVDEISVEKTPKIVPIRESLSEYSNRIRMIPEDYFGKEIEGVMRMRGLRPCILILASVDRGFADLQKRIAAEKGYELEDISATCGRFLKEGNKYELDIEKICLKNGREVSL